MTSFEIRLNKFSLKKKAHKDFIYFLISEKIEYVCQMYLRKPGKVTNALLVYLTVEKPFHCRKIIAGYYLSSLFAKLYTYLGNLQKYKIPYHTFNPS